jgi:hypothetical protein
MYLTACAEGWADRNIRAQRVLALRPETFLTDFDICSESEIRNHPIYTDTAVQAACSVAVRADGRVAEALMKGMSITEISDAFVSASRRRGGT